MCFEYFDYISFIEHFGRIRVFLLQNKMCPFLIKVFESTMAILFYETQLDQLP